MAKPLREVLEEVRNQPKRPNKKEDEPNMIVGGPALNTKLLEIDAKNGNRIAGRLVRWLGDPAKEDALTV